MPPRSLVTLYPGTRVVEPRHSFFESITVILFENQEGDPLRSPFLATLARKQLKQVVCMLLVSMTFLVIS